jgi:peptidoglycan/LPS O-acetylase OafA/YrhL
MTSDTINRKKPSGRIIGLDSIRFIAAAWVMFYHIGYPPLLHGLDRSHGLGKVIGAAYDCLFCGPASVIVFFVISGFCIHYPYRQGRKEVKLLNFLSRRYVRILLPWFVWLGFVKWVGMTYDTVGAMVGWSIECELIYYTFYPLLHLLARWCGWRTLLVITFPLSFAVVYFINPSQMMYPSFGLHGNALLGLPCWLLGCLLAEEFAGTRPISKRTIWLWRGLIVFANAACFSCMLHLKIGFPWTLNLFAIPVYFWLKLEVAMLREVGSFSENRGFSILEWGGKWSYSLYLMHGPLYRVYNSISVDFGGNWLGTFTTWSLRISFILLCSYVFYLVIEKPSHWLARRISARNHGAAS